MDPATTPLRWWDEEGEGEIRFRYTPLYAHCPQQGPTQESSALQPASSG